LTIIIAGAAGGCGQTLLPADDPTNVDGVAWRLDLALPDRLETMLPKTSPYSPNLRLYLAHVEDVRDDRVHVGVTVGEGAPAPILASGMSAPEFVGRVVAKELAGAGTTLVGRENDANRVLRLRLIRFFTEEGNFYRGEVRATAEVSDSSGHVLVAIGVAGTARQFGRSLLEADFREVLARASMDMAKSLVENGQIQRALDLRNDTIATSSAPRSPDGGAP
jgi:hypothetical protein